MIRTLIVDDDSLIHVTLRSTLEWEKYGYCVVSDCGNALQALSYLGSHPVDLLITDMKMPGMDGLALMRQLRERGHLPVTVVLSGYDEFELVREAFRLGAYDYLLKSGLNRSSLERLLTGLRKKVFRDLGSDMPIQERENELPEGDYILAAFQVQNFRATARRFGDNLKEKMEKPMLELVHQIQRLQGRAVFRAKDPGYYEMFYPVRDRKRIRDTILSVVGQVQGVWRDYMNVEVSVGISEVMPRDALDTASRQCQTLCALTVLQGKDAVCAQWQYAALAEAYEAEASTCDNFIAALCGEDDQALQEEAGIWFSGLKRLDRKAHIQRILVLLARLADRLEQYGQNYFEILPEQGDAARFLSSFETVQERELWLRSALRQVHTVCSDSRRQKRQSVMDRAKAFMQDNFNNPELTLKTVADYVGFNEKYFSARFTKECGCTFISYLNDLRIRRAQELLKQTDMKMYEIAEAVGYSSVEHFNQRFKKKLCISPSEFRQKQEKT